MPASASTRLGFFQRARGLAETLAWLRLVAIAGQALTVAVVALGLGLPIPVLPLALGIGALGLFALFAFWRLEQPWPVSLAEAFGHVAVDILVLTYLLLRGAPPEGRSDRSTLACYRDDLERRRRLLASVVRWYLAPFWPGTAFFFAGILVAQREKPGAIAVVACSALFAVAINVVIAWINHRSAQRLASELASLPRPENE